MNILPTFEVYVQDCEDIGLALVGEPAIESDFMFFEKEEVKMQFNDEKMMVRGPVLIPQKLIYRNDALGERNIFFSEDTIRKFVELLMSKEKNKFNLGHTNNFLDAILIESFFASDDNEFNVPKGSWIVGLKIKDADAWERIKGGEFRGFSVQSVFSNELVNLVTNKNQEMSKLKEQISEALNKILFPTETDAKVDVKLEDAKADVKADVKLEDEVVEEDAPKEDEADEKSVDEKIAEMKAEILAEVEAMIKKSSGDIVTVVEEFGKKVELFGKQPLPQGEKEDIDVPIVAKGKATQYFVKQK